MPELIVCRNCNESNCTYCNINILAVALDHGVFNSLMGEQHTVQIDSELVPMRHGHWIFNPKDAIEMMFALPMCSECGAESANGGNYCSNCRARMNERKEDANN